MRFAWKHVKFFSWLAVGVAAAALVLTFAMWPRSLWFQERIAYTTGHFYFAARTNPGTLTLEYERYPISPFDKGWHAWHDPWVNPSIWPCLWGGFGLEHEPFILGRGRRIVAVRPYYTIAGQTPLLNRGWTLDLPFW